MFEEGWAVRVDRFLDPLPSLPLWEQYRCGFSCGGPVPDETNDSTLKVPGSGADRGELHRRVHHRCEAASLLDKHIGFKLL